MTEVPESTRAVKVRAIPIDLCQFIKFAGLAASGGEAKQLVAEGKVQLNGVIETQKRYKAAGLADDDAVMAAFEENARDVARVGGK